MNKHQTLAYIKYGKLINKINDILADHDDIKYDIIKFLSIFPWILKDPYIFNSLNTQPKRNGSLVFSGGTKLKSDSIEIIFDGKNNFKICTYGINNLPIYPYNEWPFNNITWTSIDNIERYVDTHLDDFNDIIK